MDFSTIDKFSDAELVATVLGRKACDEAVHRMAAVLATEGWLGGLPLEEAARAYGSVGPRSLAKLEAAVELGRRALSARAVRKATTIRTPEDAVALLRPLLVGQECEHFVALALDVKGNLRRIIEVSVGSISASIVHPIPLFRELCAVSASSFILVHNHPSQDPSESGADRSLSRRIGRCAEIMGCEYLDFLIIGGDKHVSFREQGIL